MIRGVKTLMIFIYVLVLPFLMVSGIIIRGIIKIKRSADFYESALERNL